MKPFVLAICLLFAATVIIGCAQTATPAQPSAPSAQPTPATAPAQAAVPTQPASGDVGGFDVSANQPTDSTAGTAADSSADPTQ